MTVLGELKWKSNIDKCSTGGIEWNRVKGSRARWDFQWIFVKGGITLLAWLARLQNVSFDMETVPMDWRGASIVPLWKGKGDKYVYINSRGISLLSVVGKLYGRVSIKRVRDGTECAIGEESFGLSQCRGCMEQVFAVRLVCEKYLANGKNVKRWWILTRRMIRLVGPRYC